VSSPFKVGSKAPLQLSSLNLPKQVSVNMSSFSNSCAKSTEMSALVREDPLLSGCLHQIPG
ncbi:unnamed protein product, partial [Bubo scandiacus]